MATLVQKNLTLSEQMKQIGPDGNLLDIVNVLSLINEFDLDAVYQMANDRFADVSSKVIKLPDISTRRINRGSPGGVGRTKQHREFIEILEARPYIDTLLLDSEPDGGTQARLNQIKLFVEAMAQKKANDLLYGSNADDGENIDGYMVRYNDLALDNVHGVGGSSANTSLLLVEWDPARHCLIYPKAVPNGGKNQALGVSELDRGLQRITDDDGNAFDALESVIRVAFGIRVLDDRCVQRLCNIVSSGTSNNLLDTAKINILVSAVNKLVSHGRNAVIYCNADIKTQFDIFGLNKLLGCTVVEQTTGGPVTMFQNRIPIRLIESISSDETTVS